MHFDAFKERPMSGNGNLLSLSAHHPGAVIDHDAGDYRATDARLLPHG